MPAVAGPDLATHESLLDFGARLYDPAIAIFLQPDPLAEKYYNLSPYAYCANNPVNFVDSDGRFIGFISDVVSVGLGVRSFAKNISEGNIRGAVWDGVGVVVDLAAAAIPVVPGGIGYVRAGINAADNAIDAAKAVNAVDNTADAAKAISTPNNLSRTDKLRETATIGQEAHRQIEFELMNDIPGTRTEVRMTVGNKEIRKDAVLPDGTCVIIKPDTPSGHKSAAKREKLMNDNGYKTQLIFYDPNDSRWLPNSPTYIGPKK